MTTVTRPDKTATAEAYIRDFRQRNPDAWPQIKAIVEGAGVSTGTAWAALKAVKDQASPPPQQS